MSADPDSYLSSAKTISEETITLGSRKFLIFGNVFISIMLVMAYGFASAMTQTHDPLGLCVLALITYVALTCRSQMAYGEATTYGVRYKKFLRWRFVYWTEVKWIYYESLVTGPLVLGLYGPSGKGYGPLPNSRLVFGGTGFILFNTHAKEEREKRSEKLKALWTAANQEFER